MKTKNIVNVCSRQEYPMLKESQAQTVKMLNKDDSFKSKNNIEAKKNEKVQNFNCQIIP